MFINSDGLPWLESDFNAGPAAFWPAKWSDEIGYAMFLVPVSGVCCATLGHKFLVTSFWWPVTWAENLGRVSSTLNYSRDFKKPAGSKLHYQYILWTDVPILYITTPECIKW